MGKQKFSGYLMAVIGLAMLLINALSYIFDGNIKSPAFTIMGLVFVVIGLKLANKLPK